MEEGCKSATFVLEDGLSEEDKKRLASGLAEARQLMREDNLSFDEARLKLVAKQMMLMGVDSSGMPMDPKAFTFEKARPKERPSQGWGSAWRGTRRCNHLTPPGFLATPKSFHTDKEELQLGGAKSLPAPGLPSSGLRD
ncbi:unnamed protein product [Effrenium voratum]|nr:unnamed protein product [Effrenium voratum]